MSSDEELLAHGRLLAEYSQLTKRLVALKAEGRRTTTILSAFDDVLNDGPSSGQKSVQVVGENVRVSYYNATHLDASADWPTLEKVQLLANELKTAKNRLAELSRELQTLGLPIRDKA